MHDTMLTQHLLNLVCLISPKLLQCCHMKTILFCLCNAIMFQCCSCSYGSTLAQSEKHKWCKHIFSFAFMLCYNRSHGEKEYGSVCTCLEDLQLIIETKNRVTTESDDVTTEIVSKSSVMTKNIWKILKDCEWILTENQISSDRVQYSSITTDNE